MFGRSDRVKSLKALQTLDFQKMKVSEQKRVLTYSYSNEYIYRQKLEAAQKQKFKTLKNGSDVRTHLINVEKSIPKASEQDVRTRFGHVRTLRRIEK